MKVMLRYERIFGGRSGRGALRADQEQDCWAAQRCCSVLEIFKAS